MVEERRQQRSALSLLNSLPNHYGIRPMASYWWPIVLLPEENSQKAEDAAGQINPASMFLFSGGHTKQIIYEDRRGLQYPPCRICSTTNSKTFLRPRLLCVSQGQMAD